MDATDLNHIVRTMDAEVDQAHNRLAQLLPSQDISRIHPAAADLHAILATRRRYHTRYTQTPAVDKIPQERDALYLYAACCITLGDRAAAFDTATAFFKETMPKDLIVSIKAGDGSGFEGFANWLAGFPCFAPVVAETVLVLKTAAAACDPESDGFFELDAIYPTGAATLDPHAAALIRAQLLAADSDTATHTPKQLDAAKASPCTFSVLIVGNFAEQTNHWGVHAFSSFLQMTAETAGLTVDTFDASQMTYNVQTWAPSFQTELARLSETIQRTKPDVVFFLGNYIPRDGFDLGAEDWAELKRLHPFKLVTYVTDSVQAFTDHALFWRASSDLLVICAARSSYNHAPRAKHGVLAIPGWQPAPTQPIDWGAKQGLSFSGGRGRYRGLALDCLAAGGMPVTQKLWTMKELPTQSVEDYFKSCERAWYGFDLTRMSTTRILTGRFSESIMRGCIWFESGVKPVLAEFLTPWRHYIPVHTLGQLQQTILYFEAHPDERLAFAERAQQFYRDHYVGDNCGGRWAHG